MISLCCFSFRLRYAKIIVATPALFIITPSLFSLLIFFFFMPRMLRRSLLPADYAACRHAAMLRCRYYALRYYALRC